MFRLPSLSLRLSSALRHHSTTSACAMSAGGDKAGSIREAGGKFGEIEQAREEVYFRKLQAEQLKHLHDHHEEEIRQHKESVKRHQESIKRHEAKIKELNK